MPRPVRPLVVRWLPAVVAAPLLAVLTAGPSSACSCAFQDLELSRVQADAVFTGEVLRREEPSGWVFARPVATYVVRLDRVLKGEPAAVQGVVTSVSGASCGLGLPGSSLALLFADTGASVAPEAARHRLAPRLAVDPGARAALRAVTPA